MSRKLIGFIILSLIAPLAEAKNVEPFKVGERLTYHFYWGIFMVGRGTFEVTELRKDGSYVFMVRMKSNHFISALYPVEDVILSEFDSHRMRSLRFFQNRKEGGRRTWEETFFYYSLGQASTESYVSGEKKWFEIPGKEKVQDKLSVIYSMRCLDWKERAEASVLLGNDKGNYKMSVKKLKEENLKLDDFVSIPAFQVEPSTECLNGFVGKGRIWAWVSDDRYKIPLKVISKLPVGSVTALLVKVEGVEAWPYDLKLNNYRLEGGSFGVSSIKN